LLQSNAGIFLYFPDQEIRDCESVRFGRELLRKALQSLIKRLPLFQKSLHKCLFAEPLLDGADVQGRAIFPSNSSSAVTGRGTLRGMRGGRSRQRATVCHRAFAERRAPTATRRLRMLRSTGGPEGNSAATIWPIIAAKVASARLVNGFEGHEDGNRWTGSFHEAGEASRIARRCDRWRGYAR